MAGSFDITANSEPTASLLRAYCKPTTILRAHCDHCDHYDHCEPTAKFEPQGVAPLTYSTYSRVVQRLRCILCIYILHVCRL